MRKNIYIEKKNNLQILFYNNKQSLPIYGWIHNCFRCKEPTMNIRYITRNKCIIICQNCDLDNLLKILNLFYKYNKKKR